MRLFRRGEYHDIEAELRTLRPEPRPAFLAALSDDLRRRTHRARTVRRTALASALTVGMLTAFGALGGIGYASSAADSAFNVSNVERLVGIAHHSSAIRADDHNPVFGDQYRPGKGCGDKNHIHARHDECKKTH
jgi:hypothetical protein